MIKLTPLCINDEEMFVKIAESKQLEIRNVLNENKEIIFEDYKVFEANNYSLEMVVSDTRIDENLKKALMACYRYGKVVGELKKRIIKNMPVAIRAKCPYCMISEPDTIDHYLDKNKYPEFSVYSKNLIPCCHRCNNLKGTKFLDKDRRRKFIQFYYDPLPSDNFLKIEVDLKNGRPAIGNVYLEFETEETINLIIKRHFTELKLIRRYKDQFNGRLSSLYNELQLYGDYPVEKVIKILENRACALEKDYGANYWEACLYRGILNNVDLLKVMCGMTD